MELKNAQFILYPLIHYDQSFIANLADKSLSSIIDLDKKDNGIIGEMKYERDLNKKNISELAKHILDLQDCREADGLSNSSPIMDWIGQNNTLTDMFRQAKNRQYLNNTIPEIASFLKQNFTCFSKTKLSTIESMLKNNNSSANDRPKQEKTININ